MKFAVCTLGECTQEGKLQFLAFPFVEMKRLALSHGVPRSEIKNVITLPVSKRRIFSHHIVCFVESKTLD